MRSRTRTLRSNDIFKRNKMGIARKCSFDLIRPLEQAAPIDLSTLLIQPSTYIITFPVLFPPNSNWKMHQRKLVAAHMAEVSFEISKLSRPLLEKRFKLQDIASSLINEATSELQTRKSFRGRGLRENREMFFLTERMRVLRLKHNSLKLADIGEKLKYMEGMQQLMEDVDDYAQLYVSVDLQGYLKSIPNHEEKILKYQSKISDIRPHITKIECIPPPKDLIGQIMYPTSTIYKMLVKYEKEPISTTATEMFNSFHSMTDDHSEFSMIIDCVYQFAWRQMRYPFIEPITYRIPTFIDVRVELFNAPYVPDEYQKLRIGQLMGSGWPYESVAQILMELFFHINPMKMSKIFYHAMVETGNCVTKVTNTAVELDFDSIFSLILIITLSTGILFEPMMLFYIASISRASINESECKFGSSYAEAIIVHLSSLNEEEMVKETLQIEKNEKD